MFIKSPAKSRRLVRTWLIFVHSIPSNHIACLVLSASPCWSTCYPPHLAAISLMGVFIRFRSFRPISLVRLRHVYTFINKLLFSKKDIISALFPEFVNDLHNLVPLERVVWFFAWFYACCFTYVSPYLHLWTFTQLFIKNYLFIYSSHSK